MFWLELGIKVIEMEQQTEGITWKLSTLVLIWPLPTAKGQNYDSFYQISQ